MRATADGKTGERMVKVTVGGVDEAPDVSGPSTRNFPENGKDAVATFTAKDPEGKTPITWSLATAAQVGAEDDLADADNADAASFEIDEDGVLKFSSPPDFENPATTNATNNTYKVVVVACDVSAADCSGGQTGYHKVTVMVTNVDERGKITLANSNTSNITPQYLVGETLTATAEDGDITSATQTFTEDVADEVAGVTWQWYRGGTAITGADAQDNTYTLVPADADKRIRVVVKYQVDGSTRQDMAEKTTEYPVLAARIGANQLKFSPATVSRTISEGAKDRNVGTPVTATGNHGTVRYSLAESGDDNSKFEIDPKSGQIKTMFELDYEATAEATADAAGSCAGTTPTQRRTCTVTVIATDSHGEPTSGTTGDNPNATVTITITNVDEKPTFSTGAETIGVPENSTDLFGAEADGFSGATDAAGVTYTAADPEGFTVSYSLAGPDVSKFKLSGNPPVLSFKSGPDFEAKASADGDNDYEVTVRASAGGKTGERMVKVTVVNVDEAPVIVLGGLVIDGEASVDYEENSTSTVAAYKARGPNAASAMWTLEGDDADDFRLSSTRGANVMLMFASLPDFETKLNGDRDNVYMVTLKASHGSGDDMVMDTLDVTVTVTNVEERGMITLSSRNPTVDTELTATLTDPDGMLSGVTWQWSKSTTTDGTFMDIEVTTMAGATSTSYTPVQADDGYYLRATAMYTDGHGPEKSKMARTENKVIAGDPLVVRFDDNKNGKIDKNEMIAAINNYLFEDGGNPITKDQMIDVINLYLFDD